MKPFFDYLVESLKTYSFKIKIAGDLPDDVDSKLKESLVKFSIKRFSEGKRIPVSKTPLDFPALSNLEVTIWDVTVAYPTIQPILENYISTSLNLPSAYVRVTNFNDPLDKCQDAPVYSDIALLNRLDMGDADDNAQELVGQQRATGLLKELVTNRLLDPYRGVNDQILASDCPNEKSAEFVSDKPSKSPLGSNKIQFPT